MADNPMHRLFGSRKTTKRELVIMFLTGLAILGWLLYQFPYRLLEKSITTLKADIGATEKEILDLSVQYADLKMRETEIKNGAKSGIAGWELADQKGVILVLEGLSSEAKRQGVNLVAVHPTQEIDKEKYKEVSMNLDLKGRYRELSKYFKHLENLSQIVNIRKIRVEACPDASSTCATQLEAVTYMAK